MIDRAKLIDARIRQRLWAIQEAVPPINPPAAHWLDSDAGPSYCWDCAHIARGKEFDLGAPIKPAKWFERDDDWLRAFYDGIYGGFDTESDSPAACEICGRTLSYILTDYGADSEIEYYREAPLINVGDEDSYALDRLCLNIWPGSKRAQLLAAAAIVGQAYRLVARPMIDGEEGL